MTVKLKRPGKLAVTYMERITVQEVARHGLGQMSLT